MIECPLRLSPAFLRGGWGQYLLRALLISLTLYFGVSCSSVKSVFKDPASRNSVYGEKEEIVAATIAALESHHYSVANSVPTGDRISGQSENEIDPSEGFQGYRLSIILTEGNYGATDINFERVRISVLKSKDGNTEQSQPAPDKNLFQRLLRQIRTEVMH